MIPWLKRNITTYAYVVDRHKSKRMEESYDEHK